MSLQATVIKDILYAATTYGAVYDTLREMSGLTEYEIGDSNLTVEWQKSVFVWDMLADIFKNEQIGLYLGREVRLSMLGMVGFLMQSCKTLEETVEVYCEYGYMVCPMVIMKYKKEKGKAILEFHQNAMWKSGYERNARVGIDFTLASTVYFAKLLSGKNVVPLVVEMEHRKCGVDAYNQVLGCRVNFNAPLYRIIFSEDDLSLPVISSDTSIYEMFKGILEQKKTIFMQQNTGDALKNLLFMQFKGQIPTIEEAANHLNMTVRTLQRKLMDENTSYRTISNQVKKQLAMHLIRNAGATEVAGVMGYADLPAFRRAFKSWTNATPKEIKRKLTA